MRIDRNTRMADDERPHGRPSGHSISYSQATSNCDLRLSFRRRRIKVSVPTGIAMIIGRALHSGGENMLRGAAKTPAQAVSAALRTFHAEVSKAESGPGVRWDDWHERNLDGSISLKEKNFGSLPSPEFVEFWLVRQLALWLLVNRDLKIRYSEHRIFVPLRGEAHWKTPWSLEMWLDIVVVDEEGWGIVDLKTSGAPWEAREIHKGTHQADLYMGGMAREMGSLPARPFEFHILPRTKASLPALQIAYDWLHDKLTREEALAALRAGGAPKVKVVTKGRGRKAVKTEEPVLDAEGRPVLDWTLSDALQVVSVNYDVARVNTYLQGVIRPKVNLIEAGAFVANPDGWWCDKRFCDFYGVCAFGDGDLL